MRSLSKRLLAGTGIGCALLFIVAMIVTGGVLYFIQKNVALFEDVHGQREKLLATYGNLRHFSPPPSGRIAPERLEIFLEIQETTSGARERVADNVAGLEIDLELLRMESPSFLDLFWLAGRGLGAVPSVAEFLRLRNRAMVEHGMGYGEYFYLFVLTYHTFLDHPLAEGVQGLQSGENPSELQEELSRSLRTFINGAFREILDNVGEGDRGKNGELFREELERLQESSQRLPWEDRLPRTIKESLEPFREYLEASYDPSSHLIELIALAEDEKVEIETGESPQ